MPSLVVSASRMRLGVALIWIVFSMVCICRDVVRGGARRTTPHKSAQLHHDRGYDRGMDRDDDSLPVTMRFGDTVADPKGADATATHEVETTLGAYELGAVIARG